VNHVVFLPLIGIEKAKMSFIHVRDIGAAAAMTLIEEHAGKKYGQGRIELLGSSTDPE
jgi:hypothetical protein